MDFYDVVAQVVQLLQQQGRVTYRGLQAQFKLDDETLEALKEEILYSQPQVVDDESKGLIWTGAPAAPVTDARHGTAAEWRLQALLPEVMIRLQRERRVTYRTLKLIFGLNDTLLGDIRKELGLRRLAIDEDGEVLVWTGETQPVTPPVANVSSQATIVDTTVVPSPAGAAPSPVTEPRMPSNGPTAPAEAITTDVSQDQSVAPPDPVRSAPEAERRQLTVMFCDLADSTTLSQQLDPEDLRDVVRAYQSTATAVIQHYAGHIAQYLGDGLLIYFGWPVAHEDDAQRALHSGLGIVEAITTSLNPRLEQEKGVKLTVRLGVHTGPVVVGEMGGGGRHEHLATGETVNIAARLEGLAAPNTVVISNVTARLVQGAFGLEALGTRVLKGVAEPMGVFRVLRPLDTDRDQDESMPDGGVFLVGRDAEIGLLLRRWEQAKAGLGQVVLISGEAGIGKSSLVTMVRTHVVDEGYTRLTFHCSPYHTNSALYPVIAHVQRVLHFQPGDTPAAKLGKLERVLSGYSRPLEGIVPLVAAWLSVPVPEERYAALNVTPQQQRQQTQDALVGWLLEEAERHPTLAVWEDLHWADPSTLEMLGLVLEQTPTVPMLHVLTSRPAFASPWPPRSHMTPITLNRLERPQVEALIRHRAGGKTLPAEAVEHIVVKTDGVPLYVEELTTMLLESALLREEADRYVLTGPLTTVAIPNTLQDSLMARLDRLDTGKELAQLGAVLGREFSYEMLQAVSPQDEATLQTGLTQLVDAELLYQRGRPPRSRYIFKHALIQDAAYASLLKSTRQRVHQQIAQVLEAQFPETAETQPELMAHHYTEAGENEAAISYWQRAGQRALQGSAHAEAIAHLRQGLALLKTLPETREHRQQELDLQVALGAALRATMGNAAPDVERAYARARELCQQVEDTTQIFPVLRGLMLYYSVSGQQQTAYQLGEELLSLARSHPDPAYLMLAYFQLGMVLFAWGETAAAHSHHAQALTIYLPQEHRDLAVRFGIDLGVSSHSWLAWELWQLGYPDQALQHSQEARTLAHEVSHAYSLVHAVVWAATLHQFRREVSAAYEQAEAAITLATEQGFAERVAWSMGFHGWALAMQGQGEAGIAEIRQGIAACLATESKWIQAYFLGLLAEAYGEDGHPEEALHILAEALVEMDTTEVRFYAAELYRLKGALLLRQAVPHVAQAASCFHEALSIARQQQAKSWELRAATSLARLWQSQGKRQEAYDLLAPVYEWFTEGFDTADLKDAKALLEALR
jgi:predicted ATPase/class 3 adenylate cyclase